MIEDRFMSGTFNERFQKIVGRIPDRVAFSTKGPSGYKDLT